MTPQTRAVPLVLTGLLVAGLTALPAPAPAVPGTSTYTQPTGVYVGDEAHQMTTTETVTFGAGGGEADVYPSEAEVPHFARIVDVDVSVTGLTHANPDDVQLVLAQQGGPQVTLMANAGGSTDAAGVQLNFDGDSSQSLPDETALATSGTYHPTAHGDLSQLPSTSLSAFNGVPVSSTWQLFAYDDDGAAATGSFDQWYVVIGYETSPYPSQLQVSGLGSVTDVDVTLHGLTSDYPDDLDLLLVGPTGQQATLMSDAAGGEDLDHIELTFDDEASAPVTDTSVSPLPTGTYRPANYDGGPGDDVYPTPAPAPTGATTLSAFDGTDPNGSWRLFATDDQASDVTAITGGWSLDIDWNDAAAPTGSVSVAGGAAATKTSSVTLDLAATDPAPATGVKEMRFSNDGTTYSAFQPYAATAAWTLSKGDGAKTVYAQFRDAAGNVSAVSSDTVVLDTTSPQAKKLRPRKNATDVKPKAKVRVVATEALDPATVTKRSVVLKHDGVKVRGKVTYLAARHAILLKPRKRLEPGDYKVIVKTRITDLVGNRFDTKKKKGLQRLTWTFTVG